MKHIIFDLDETLGTFVQLGIFKDALETTFKINIAPFLSTTSLYSAHRTSKTQLGQPVLHLHEEANSYPYSTKSVNNGRTRLHTPIPPGCASYNINRKGLARS